MRRRPGFTLIEMMIVVVMIGLMTAIAAPRLRVSPRQRVESAARIMVNDLETARTRALSTRRSVLLVFDQGAGEYRGYLDFNNDTAFARSSAEMDSLRFFRARALTDGVVFGRGAATAPAPGDPAASGAITLPGDTLLLDTRGLPRPFGTGGYVYLTHADDPGAVVAVALRQSGAFRAFTRQGDGAWR